MRDLTNGHVGGQILKFTAPMLIGNIFQQAYHIIDCILVGKLLGVEALAAVGASFPIIFALISFVIGIASGGTVIISQYFGAKKYGYVRKTIDTLYIFIFFASIVIMTIGITFSGYIFKLVGLPAELVPKAMEYINTLLLGTLFLFGFNGTSAILRGLGDSVTPLVFLVISSFFNIIFVYVFIKYFGWGIKGAAFATVLAQGGAFFSTIFYLNKTHKIVQLKLKELVLDWEIFRKSVQIGLPSGLQQTFVSLGMVALLSIVNGFGTSVLAAYTVVGRIDNIAMLPAMNFGQALSSFTGQNIGANKIGRVRDGLVATLSMSTIISALITIIVIIFRFQLMHLFTSDEIVVLIGARYLVIVGSTYFIFSIMFTLSGVLRGAGDTLIPMFITLVSLWFIRIPFAWLLSGKFSAIIHNYGYAIDLPAIFSGKLKETGIWWSIPLAWLLGAIFSFWYYMKGSWKNKVIVQPERQ
jgi:putative MATE family efflux protein